MQVPPRINKAQLVRLISELEKKPHDRIRILGDAGVTVFGTGLGAAAAGTIATAAGVTSVWGLTSVAGWFGLSAVAATPVGWVIGCAAVAGGAAYGISRLIRGGALSEGRRFELLQKYREERVAILAKEVSGEIDESDRVRFICSIRELIERDVLPPNDAIRLIEQVERGGIAISMAMSHIHALLHEKVSD